MARTITSLLSEFKEIHNKIAFYPTLFAIAGFLLSFLMIILENRGISKYLVEEMPGLVVNSGDTALTILSACITGLISMMVFSFSMVMVLLNQASNNYSPRLLPGLISDKNHQIILGIYLATILYCIFIAVSIQPEGEEYQIPGFSVLLGIFFTVVCIWAFIYFIHNISQNIQINNILDKIYHKAQKRLNYLLQTEENRADDFPDTTNWHSCYAEHSGYFQHLGLENLLKICRKKEVQIHIIPVKGVFVLKGLPLFKTSIKLEEDDLQLIRSNIIFSRGELVERNYVLAFKQITEIIVKAMSPGINDPGTALNGIDYLNELFALRMQKRDYSIMTTEVRPAVKLNVVSFDELLYNVMGSIRAYCKHDVSIVQNLAYMFIYLRKQKACNEAYYYSLEREAKNLFLDARTAMTNSQDLELIDRLENKFTRVSDE
ncbi:DUF2254 domain-containing protein [Salegentibacter sp. HM20]